MTAATTSNVLAGIALLTAVTLLFIALLEVPAPAEPRELFFATGMFATAGAAVHLRDLMFLAFAFYMIATVMGMGGVYRWSASRELITDIARWLVRHG